MRLLLFYERPSKNPKSSAVFSLLCTVGVPLNRLGPFSLVTCTIQELSQSEAHIFNFTISKRFSSHIAKMDGWTSLSRLQVKCCWRIYIFYGIKYAYIDSARIYFLKSPKLSSDFLKRFNKINIYVPSMEGSQDARKKYLQGHLNRP